MSDRDIEGWSEINTQSDRIAFLRECWPDLVRRIEREALRSEPTLDATHDIRRHYPYHHYPHPDDHVHATEPGLDEGLIEQALNIIRAGTETAWLRRDYYLWKDQANDFLTALAARGTNDE